MDILSHFDITTDTIITFILKDGERDEFLQKLPTKYQLAFVSEKDLKARVDLFGTDNARELAELIPDRGNIRSGDFGEILAYLIFKERHKAKGIDGPLKWRWKQNKNTAAPYTDVILFSIEDLANPSTDDLLVSIESKMKASNTNLHPIQEAINGAHGDYVSRIANSLAWLRRKYKEEALKKDVDVDEIKTEIAKLERFINSDQTVTYTKKVKAIAFINKAWFDVEVAKAIEVPSDAGLDLTICAVSIEDLQGAYEEVLTKALTA